MYDHKALRQRHIGQWVEREALGIKELTVRQADLGIERVERHNVAHPVLAGGRERGALECAPARSRPELLLYVHRLLRRARLDLGHGVGLGDWPGASDKIGRAHVWTPVNNALLVCC